MPNDLTRATRTQLSRLGFDNTLDLRRSVDPNDVTLATLPGPLVDIGLELSDPLQGHEIRIQVAAFRTLTSQEHQSGPPPPAPRSVFFTFHVRCLPLPLPTPYPPGTLACMRSCPPSCPLSLLPSFVCPRKAEDMQPCVLCLRYHVLVCLPCW